MAEQESDVNGGVGGLRWSGAGGCWDGKDGKGEREARQDDWLLKIRKKQAMAAKGRSS